MVPDIEYVHTGLKLVAFFEGKRLDQRKVPVLLERPAESISRNSAERLDSRACRVWNGWCRGKAGWIYEVVQPARDWACCVNALSVTAVVAERSRFEAIAYSKSAASGAIKRGKR